jgi:hypothetical protein
MGEESLPRQQRLSLMRMRRRELNGARASTGEGYLQHTLGMLDEATTLVEERWCARYTRSGHFSALNPKMRSGG